MKLAKVLTVVGQILFIGITLSAWADESEYKLMTDSNDPCVKSAAILGVSPASLESDPLFQDLTYQPQQPGLKLKGVFNLGQNAKAIENHFGQFFQDANGEPCNPVFGDCEPVRINDKIQICKTLNYKN
jgi:hypothetical protein